jgi:hypothetical protein
MNVKEWASRQIRARSQFQKDHDTFPLADETIERWPHVRVQFERYQDIFDDSSDVIDGCKNLMRQIKHEMDLSYDDFIVVTNQPFDGVFVIAFDTITSAIQCRMISEGSSEIHISAGYPK